MMRSEDSNNLDDQKTRMAEGTVSEQMFNLLKEWTYCDLILDRELSDPLSADHDELATQGLALSINPKAAARPFDRSLMAARISLGQLDVLERSIDISLEQNTDSTCQVRAVGGWIFSRDTSPERTAYWLEKAMIVRVHGAPKALLRVWDPRVIGHLARILTQEQLADLLGPVDAWAWVDRAGQLQLLSKPILSGQVRGQGLPLLLSAEQDAAIDRIEDINILLKTLSKLGHNMAPQRDQELDQLLCTAQRKGHRALPDKLAYCLHALLISTTFDAIPAVQQAIGAAHAQGMGLCAALDEFDDAYWDTQKLSASWPQA